MTSTNAPVEPARATTQGLCQIGSHDQCHPDRDVQPAGPFGVFKASETMSAIQSPEGACLGSMCTENKILLQAYRNTTSPLGDSLQAIAKLIARYKDGS